MIEYISEYEKGELKAERDVESGAVENAFIASREADAFLRDYNFSRYNNGEDFRQFKMGYASRLHEISIAQGPADPYGFIS